MKKHYIYILVLFYFIYNIEHIQAQAPVVHKQIVGKVLDDETNHAVEYVTVALFDNQSKSLITGTITDKEGRFVIENIKKGQYYIELSFMGYEKISVDDITVSDQNPKVDLGTIKLIRNHDLIEEVEVIADKPAVDYQIDKKVINVSEQFTTASGTAIDVLENVPSVTVDVEGNLSLRGSTGFTVLIDGKPSVLDGSEALEQLPASIIENIEIITNPSVKYDPDGTSGIINVITKKNKLRGINGIANVNLGLDNKYGGDILLNFRKNKLDFYVSADYNDREYPGFENSERMTTINDTSFYILSNGKSDRKSKRWSLRSGISIHPDTNNTISFDFRYGYRKWQGISEYDYSERTEPATLLSQTNSFDESERSGNFYSINMQYYHQFAKKGHEINVMANYSDRTGTESHTNNLQDNENTILNGQYSTEVGPSASWRIQIDYTLPLSEKGKFEAGYQSRIGKSEDNTELYLFNTITELYDYQPDYSNQTDYNRSIHSIYSLYANEIEKFGYQLGLRGEYTLREVLASSGQEKFVIDRWDYFPTLHVSYSINKKLQLMSSYSRRIERPRGWWLEPFLTWSDAYNVRSGNPNLQPEYIDAFELNFISKMDKNFFSVETYYRITNNYTDYLRTVWSENTILSYPENVGKAFALGAEAMLSYELFKSWQINLSGNLYEYKVEGNILDQDFSNESLNWNTRLNNNFKITKNLQVQLNGSYNSPTATSQGTSEGYFSADAAVKTNLFDRKLTVALQMRDVFQTAKREQTTRGQNFYYYSKSYRKAPYVMLTLSYKFNNYRNGEFEKGNEFNSGGDDEF